MLANACFNGFLLCMYPGFDEMQRKDAQAEIQDYLAANPAFAAQAVTMGVAAGSAVAQSNPGMYYYDSNHIYTFTTTLFMKIIIYGYYIIGLAQQGMTALMTSQQPAGYAKVNNANAV